MIKCFKSECGSSDKDTFMKNEEHKRHFASSVKECVEIVSQRSKSVISMPKSILKKRNSKKEENRLVVSKFGYIEVVISSLKNNKLEFCTKDLEDIMTAVK